MAGVVEKVKNFCAREWQNDRAREANKVRNHDRFQLELVSMFHPCNGIDVFSLRCRICSRQ